MAEPKDGESFFRKVVRFVANPATEWSEAAPRQDDGQELERSELKAMVERKRRNDFVRKREFDTLRKLRRDGLSPEQLAALGGSSGAEDSEARLAEGGARMDAGVKAKIDEIEQQMVGDHSGHSGHRPTLRRRTATPRPAAAKPQHPTDFYTAPTAPVLFEGGRRAKASPLADAPASLHPSLDDLPALPPLRDSVLPLDAAAPQAPAAAPQPAGGLTQFDAGLDGRDRLAVEVNEMVHDPDLDEPVISFANADFNQSEQALVTLCRPKGPRSNHAETWLVLFDLYRAIGQQQKFEALSLEFADQFGKSSPQWYSLPRRVADAAAAVEVRPDTRGVRPAVGWSSPSRLDIEAVARLRSSTLQLPLPWVLDWSALERVEVEAAAQLSVLFRQWAPQPIDMRWLAAERLLNKLQEAAPTGVRDADPAFWMVRLEALRLSNRPDQFDETAIDYCVTFEVSPPSWEPARCQVRAGSTAQSASMPSMSVASEVSSSFLESSLHDDSRAGPQVASVELSGQLIGDISATLKKIDRKLGTAALVHVSCARLIRVDFIAAGDLLNWVLAKQGEKRSISFVDTHRLVALFFGAMGINEHARVLVPRD